MMIGTKPPITRGPRREYLDGLGTWITTQEKKNNMQINKAVVSDTEQQLLSLIERCKKLRGIDYTQAREEAPSEPAETPLIAKESLSDEITRLLDDAVNKLRSETLEILKATKEPDVVFPKKRVQRASKVIVKPLQ